MPAQFPAIAGGDIRPARFIKLSTAADHTVLEADANEMVIGVSVNAQQDAPIPGSSPLAAQAGDNMMFYGIGEECPIEVGTGGVTRGAMCKSDADGKSVLAATTGTVEQWVGALAMESAAAGEKAKHVITVFPRRPALT